MDFIKGSTYTRNDIHTLYFGNPVPETGTGNWTSGYVRIDDELIVFMNINVPGTTGHDFPNSFDEETKTVEWFGKPNSNSKQPTFIKLMNGELTPHFFARWDNKTPFTYLGVGKIVNYVDGNPTVFKNGQPTKNIKLTLTLDSAAASLEFDTSYNPVSKAKVIIGGQGFSSSSKTRKAIELAAIDKAEKHYRSLEWNVEGVSSNHPYDLRCTMPTESELHVEVKGTTSDGSSVLLTPGEVKHNEQFPKAGLFILHSLNVQEDGSGNVHVSGGTVTIYSPWDVHAGTLSPIGYEYFPS
jgi:hypothetical protein